MSEIFTSIIREKLKNHPNSSIVVNSKTGTYKIIGPFIGKILSMLTPEQREKFFGINNKEIPNLIAKHKVSSKAEYEIIKENLELFNEIGIVSPQPTKKELSQSVQRTWKTISKDN